MRNLCLVIYLVLILLLPGCGGTKDLITPTTASDEHLSPAEALARLNNNSNTEDVDIFECPKRHPGYTAAGETGGWIIAHKQILNDSGVFVRWNCEKKMYEITQAENQTALCGCK